MSLESQTFTSPGPSIMLSARAFINYWFNSSGISLKQVLTDKNLMDNVKLDYSEQFRAFKVLHPDSRSKPVPKDLLESAFRVHLDDYIAQCRQSAVNQFKCTIPNLDILKSFITAVTGSPRDLDVAVLAHWLWQVKRNATGLPVRYSIMPILLGDQGGGKTSALEKLIAPWSDFRVNLKMNQLGEERFYEAFGTNFVALFDELQGIERTDMNALKNQITTISNTYRRLHTHTVLTIPMRCSFIGATNRPLNELFSDSTGMRRFFEMKALAKLDWPTINGIDYLALWQGIDESLESGYMTGEVLTHLAKEQELLVNKEPIEIFMQDHNVMPDSDTHRAILAADIYAAYATWCASYGINKPLDQTWCTRKLKNRGLPSFTERSGRQSVKVYFKVHPDCSISKNKASAVQHTVLEFKKEET